MQKETDSILLSTKKLLGLPEEYTEFDSDIIMHINTVLGNLIQIGVTKAKSFVVTSKDDVWTDFLPDVNELPQIKSFVYLKVRLMFDPPSNSVLVENINRQLAELEWRMYTQKGGY